MIKAPESWKRGVVADLCDFSNGHGFKQTDWSDIGLPIIRIQNLNGSKNFNYFQGEPQDKWLVEPGTILFAWAGTKGVSFGPKVWNGKLGVLNQHIYKIHPKADVNKDWLFLLLLNVTRQIEQKAHGFKSTLLHVKKSDITDQLVAIPSLPEQEKIAEILGTWDEAIGLEERLIAALQMRKKGLMQRLLTGKVRFPGFDDDWEDVKLGEVVTFLDGKRRPLKKTDRERIKGNIPYYGASGIIDYVNDFLFNEPLILLGEDGENILSRNTPLAFQIRGKAWINNHAHVIRPEPNVDITFLTEYLESLSYHKFNTGTAQPKLNKATCEKIRITLPPLEEQTQIGQLANKCNDEISLRQQKLAALQNQKKGLMQRLLTGQVRVSV